MSGVDFRGSGMMSVESGLLGVRKADIITIHWKMLEAQKTEKHTQK